MTKQYKQPEEVKANDIPMNQTTYLNELVGILETVSTAPAGKPTTLIDQIKIYVNGATYRLYWYDAKNNVWHYVTATA